MAFYRDTLRRGLLDFHIGEAVPDITFDVPRYMREMAEAGVQTLTFMTKDAFGTSYYNTRIGRKNAKLDIDLLAEAVREAKKYGIRLIAYYNVGLNSYVANANPDYRQSDQNGEPIRNAFGFYDLLCLNSPYRDYVAAQLAEIAENYDVDGFFFDITYVWPSACHCEYCQIWPIRNIKIKIRKKPSRVYLAPERIELPFAVKEDGIEFVIPEVGLHAMAVLEEE